ncbi:hypothetical protein AAG906_007761 [Vitis piasezkii]|uniref:Uncharacterized protein n=1 Tax=Vitis vinifera TaxID=29760 RepID=A0A438FQB2_VITVI|nr:hypothetical protein CK203_064636 [Vitis vinifera]
MSAMWEDSTCGYAMLLLVSSLLHWNSQLQNHPPQGNITHVPQQYLRPSQQHEGLLIAPTQQASSDISEVTYWYPCSGATHHLTLELNNIMNKSQFSAPDQVFMGNGKGLPIHHIVLLQCQLKRGLYVFDNLNFTSSHPQNSTVSFKLCTTTTTPFSSKPFITSATRKSII